MVIFLRETQMEVSRPGVKVGYVLFPEREFYRNLSLYLMKKND